LPRRPRSFLPRDTGRATGKRPERAPSNRLGRTLRKPQPTLQAPLEPQRTIFWPLVGEGETRNLYRGNTHTWFSLRFARDASPQSDLVPWGALAGWSREKPVR